MEYSVYISIYVKNAHVGCIAQYTPAFIHRMLIMYSVLFSTHWYFFTECSCIVYCSAHAGTSSQNAHHV